jgi:hypothetical protein
MAECAHTHSQLHTRRPATGYISYKHCIVLQPVSYSYYTIDPGPSRPVVRAFEYAVLATLQIDLITYGAVWRAHLGKVVLPFWFPAVDHTGSRD